MRLRVFRLGLVAFLLFAGLLWTMPAAQAQDQASLANTANNAMQRMSKDLSSALSASNETTAKANVNAAISAGEKAIAALTSLRDVATDDVVRSRSQAALDQTSSAVAKAREALGRSGDAFRGGVQAALADVNEAIAEFAPVLQRVGQVTTTARPVQAATTTPAAQQLPKAGEASVDGVGLAGIGMLGLGLLAAGAILRRRPISPA